MSALTLQMFGVPVAGHKPLPTNAEASDDFAAVMVTVEEAVLATKDGRCEQVPLPDPALLVAPQMILVGRMPPHDLPGGPQTPQAQALIATSLKLGASASSVAELPVVPPRQPQPTGFGSQSDDLPVAAVPMQALTPEVVPMVPNGAQQTLPGMLPSTNMPAFPAAATSGAMVLPNLQQDRNTMIQKEKLSFDAMRSQDRAVPLVQADARDLPDLGVSPITPPKSPTSVQTDPSAALVLKMEPAPPTQQLRVDRAQLQEKQGAPALAKTAEPSLAKVDAPPGISFVPGAAMVGLSRRNPDALMREAAPDPASLPMKQAPIVANAPALVQPHRSVPDLAVASDTAATMPQPATRSQAAHPMPLGKIAMAVPNPPTVADQSCDLAPEDAHAPAVVPTGPEKPSHPVHPNAGSSAESAWQTRLQVQHVPVPMSMGVQIALSPDLTLPQEASDAIIAAIFPDDASVLPPPASPRTAVGDARDLTLSWAAETTQLVKAKAVGDLVELHATGGDAKSEPAVASGLALLGSMIRPEQGDVVKPVVLSPVLVPKLAAQIVPQAQLAETGAVEVVLHPEELGSVRFQIQHHGESVRVILCVERPETLELVRRHADLLMQEFRQAGFSGATLGFGSWAQQGGQPDTPPPPADKPQPEDASFVAPAAVRAAVPSAVPYGGHGLNLRL